MIKSNAVYAVLDTYPDDLRALFLDSVLTADAGVPTPKLPPIEPKVPAKDVKKKSTRKSARKTARRRASINARLSAYVRDYSIDLQKLFDDIVAATSPETDGNNIVKPASAPHQADQSQKPRLPVYGPLYLKERLELMCKRSKISVIPLTKKVSKKRRIKRRTRAHLVDKLDILRKKFQLIKKDDPSSPSVQELSEPPKDQELSEPPKDDTFPSSKKTKKIGSKEKKRGQKKKKKAKKSLKSKVKNTKKNKCRLKAQRKTRKTLRRTNVTNKKIRKKQGILG